MIWSMVSQPFLQPREFKERGGCPDYSQPQEFKESAKAPRDSFTFQHLITACQPFSFAQSYSSEVYEIVVKVLRKQRVSEAFLIFTSSGQSV
jgi:hypothetical protein